MTTTQKSAIALAAICLLPVALYLPFLTEPFQRDEGFYATVGQLILRGDLPYRDAFDNKPPLVFGWYALSFAVFGEHVWAPRLVVSLLLSATTLLVYIEGRLLFSVRAGLIAALAFALSLAIARLGTNANTEYFLVLPMTAGLVSYTVAMQSGGSRWYFLAGFLNGVAIVTKETALFPFAFLLLFQLLSPTIRGHGRSALARDISLVCIGAVAAGLLALLPFVLSGALDDFYDAGVTYTLKYLGDSSLLERVGTTLFTFIPLLVFAGPWVLLSAMACLQARRSPDPERHWLLLGWFTASFIGISIVGRFYAHYYVQLLPAMSLLVPSGLVFIQQKRQERQRLGNALAALVVFFAALAMLMSVTAYARSSAEARHLAKAPNDYLSEWENQSSELAAYIRERTSDGDLVYNLGFQSELYFYSDRQSPTRFLFDRMFAIDDAYLSEALRDLEANPPLYVIDSARYEPPREDAEYDRSAIDAFLDEHYQYLGKVYYADVYRLLP